MSNVNENVHKNNSVLIKTSLYIKQHIKTLLLLYRGFISLGVHFACLSFVVVTPVYCAQFALIMGSFCKFWNRFVSPALSSHFESLFHCLADQISNVVVCWIY